MSIKDRFAELRDEVVDLLDRAAKVMENVVPHLGDERASGLPQTFQERANTVKSEEFVVVVVGEMNRGKSMLLNAMMRKQLLTMDVLECTATVNFLRYPKAERDQSPGYVEVHFTDERPPEKVPVDKLADYTSRLSALGSDKVADSVHHVDAFVESHFLADNVLLVDTPGTNTTTHNHIRITNDQIDRSNAAIFLFGAETQMTRSDREFLEGVEEAVARLFFVVNKIDSVDRSEVSRVLERVEGNIRNVVDQSKMRRVFGVSGAKALIGRTGYARTPILAENERGKLEDPRFCKTLIEESGIDAFEDDLERYLFGGGKGRDLLHSPLSFIKSEAAKLIDKLNRQLEVLDGTFDLSGLEREIEETERIVEDRKRELEGMTDELSEELSQELLKAQEAFEEQCKLALEAIRDELNAYDSHEALKDNWNNGARLADLPGRKLAALDRQAGKFLNDAVGRVLRKQTREIRKQIRSELGEVTFDLPEVPEMTFQLQAPKIDGAEEAKLKKSEREIEDIDRQLEKLDDARAGIDEHRYNDLKEKRQQLSEEYHSELQHLGSRPEVRVYTEVKQREVPSGGAKEAAGGSVAGGALGFFLGGPLGAAIGAAIGGGGGGLIGSSRTVQESYEETVRDDTDRKHYDQCRRNIQTEHAEKLAELDRLAEKAKEKYDAEVLARRRFEKLEELKRNREQALKRVESQYREKKEKARKSALVSAKGELVNTFQRVEETLKAAVEHCIGQTEKVATDFIENAMAELDATLKDHNQELAKLQSMKEVKESERDTAKEGITQAIEDLETLKETATHLNKKHEAFVAEAGEEK